MLAQRELQVWRCVEGKVAAGRGGRGSCVDPHLHSASVVPEGPATGPPGTGCSRPSHPITPPLPPPSSSLHLPQAQLQGNRALDASDRTVVQGKLSRIANRLKQLVGA